MGVDEKGCYNCKYKDVFDKDMPCIDCYIGIINNDPTKWAPATDETQQDTANNNYDQHYICAHQPIETMQANMSHDEFIGFLKGNIIKYVCRLGKKDDAKKEAAKIRRYSEWLEQAVNGKTIDPRK